MATLTAACPPPHPIPNQTLTLDTLPCIDLSTLTQSELSDLSLCSPTAFDLRRTHDLVIPSIDRSIFNESAGSRRQTFSRPSPNNHHSHHHHPLRHRLPGLLPSPKPPPAFPPLHDPEIDENRSIISSLKLSLKSHPEFQHLDFSSPSSYSGTKDGLINAAMRDTRVSFDMKDTTVTLGKRKRGRKPKAKVGSSTEEAEWGLEIVNKNGVAVDLFALADMEDPFGEELRRRTEGVAGNEVLLLGFMRDLGGQWCSRRRKRKIIDANIFGDVLPVGWKLLLGLKRREGRVSVYCRRYISPGGRHFVTCKEVSEYLQSYFGPSSGLHQSGDSIRHDHPVASVTHAGASQKENDQRQSNDRVKEVSLLGIENLADVQIHDLFECHKCNMSFDDKDTYLEHLLSFHQRTTRRYRLGSSVGDGVIVRDGKFECQFCHKVFHERRRYNGHVGIHVRNYVRGIEDSPSQLTLQRGTEGPTKEELPSRISKMDALIEIAQNSILETISAVPSDGHGPNDRSSPERLHEVSIPASITDHEAKSDSTVSESGMGDSVINRALDQDLYLQNSQHITNEEKMKTDDDSNVVRMDACLDVTISMSANEQNGNASVTSVGKYGKAFNADALDKSGMEEKIDSEKNLFDANIGQSVSDVGNDVNLVCSNTSKHFKSDEVDNCKNVEIVFDFGRNDRGVVSDVPTETVHQTFEENIRQGEVSESSISLLQPSCIPALPAISEGEDGLCSVVKTQDNVTGFKELRFDETEQLNLSLTGQDSLQLPEVPMDLAASKGMEAANGSSVQFESEEVMLDMAGDHQLTAVCVWCGVNFTHDAIDSQMHSDSVGYMCPSCKAKIPG